MDLTTQNVCDTMRYVLFKEDEIIDGKPTVDPVTARGVIHQFGFHPARLEEKRADVKSMLSQLPDEFHKNKGGGMSFLRMCMTKDGVQWGEHPVMDDLICLGIGLGLVGFCVPDRVMWQVLPGGVPYIWVDV